VCESGRDAALSRNSYKRRGSGGSDGGGDDDGGGGGAQITSPAL